MDALFGLSMNTIMIVLLGLLAVSLAVVAYVILRNRIVFLMGVRSIPRRMAQTVLIVLGLMLSTLIISAALTTGDTVDHSITDQSYTLMGHIDETVMPPSLADDWVYEGDSRRRISADQYQAFQRTLQEANDPDIDGSTGVLFEEVPIFNTATRLSEPTVTLTGVDSASMEAFPDIISATTGETLDLNSLGPDEAYLNESTADQIDAIPGAVVQIYVQNEPHDLTIVDVVEDRVLTGVGQQDDQEGMVTRLDTLHSLFGHDELSFIAVSSRGEIRDTGGLTKPVETRLHQMIEQNDLQLALGKSKQDSVDLAEDIGNIMASFFLVLGLFSIGAGVLLIIMIFVMLAAERRSEMGMARAVGMKRGHLVQMFTSEGMAYNIVSAMIGAGLGILVAIGMSYLMGAIFSSELFGLKIEPYVSPRTLAISYSLGVVLTFFTVAISSWRVSNLNIVSAIRGTEEPRKGDGRRGIRWRWILASIPFMVVPPLGLWFLLRNGLGLPSAWIISAGGLLFGFLFFLMGINSDSAFPFAWLLADDCGCRRAAPALEIPRAAGLHVGGSHPHSALASHGRRPSRLHLRSAPGRLRNVLPERCRNGDIRYVRADLQRPPAACGRFQARWSLRVYPACDEDRRSLSSGEQVSHRHDGGDDLARGIRPDDDVYYELQL